jgi:hypothetical protein
LENGYLFRIQQLLQEVKGSQIQTEQLRPAFYCTPLLGYGRKDSGNFEQQVNSLCQEKNVLMQE